MRSCTDNIARLEASLASGQPGMRSLNLHGLAHRHGVVSHLSCPHLQQLACISINISAIAHKRLQYLCRPHDKMPVPSGLLEDEQGPELCMQVQALILSERLQAVGTIFDRCRSVRYQQLLQQQRQLQQKRKRLNDIQVSASMISRYKMTKCNFWEPAAYGQISTLWPKYSQSASLHSLARLCANLARSLCSPDQQHQ